ncbi:winged helix-turn-helix domain-containing protein [Enterococcus sp. LJL99]
MMNIGLISSFDDLFRETLEQKGFNIRLIKKKLKEDLLGLDGIIINLPEDGKNILSWLTEIRKYSDVLVWISLPEKKDKMSSLLYLYSGADGVFSKEDSDELILVINRVFMRKIKKGNYDRKHNLILIPESLSVKLGECTVYLTKREYKLLAELLVNPDDVKSYEYLSNLLWGSTQKKAQLATLSLYLRKKLRDYNDYIEVCTIRGLGYKVKLHED